MTTLRRQPVAQVPAAPGGIGPRPPQIDPPAQRQLRRDAQPACPPHLLGPIVEQHDRMLEGGGNRFFNDARAAHEVPLDQHRRDLRITDQRGLATDADRETLKQAIRMSPDFLDAALLAAGDQDPPARENHRLIRQRATSDVQRRLESRQRTVQADAVGQHEILVFAGALARHRPRARIHDPGAVRNRVAGESVLQQRAQLPGEKRVGRSRCHEGTHTQHPTLANRVFPGHDPVGIQVKKRTLARHDPTPPRSPAPGVGRLPVALPFARRPRVHALTQPREQRMWSEPGEPAHVWKLAELAELRELQLVVLVPPGADRDVVGTVRLETESHDAGRRPLREQQTPPTLHPGHQQVGRERRWLLFRVDPQDIDHGKGVVLDSGPNRRHVREGHEQLPGRFPGGTGRQQCDPAH